MITITDVPQTGLLLYFVIHASGESTTLFYYILIIHGRVATTLRHKCPLVIDLFSFFMLRSEATEAPLGLMNSSIPIISYVKVKTTMLTQEGQGKLNDRCKLEC